jgi:cellulose synthase/poly-beta-1,6-N-acetylglucosamine synthase-like glycosyltransferase
MYLKHGKKVKKDPKPTRFPTVSVLIPAYNSEKTIAQCIESVLNLNYPKKIQVLVVDDGSTDNTGKIAKKYPIKYLRVKHGGKSRAMNKGLKKIKSELVATLDSDSFVSSDALIKMIGYLEDPNTAAVIPAIKIHNTNKMLERLQNIEYIYAAFLRKLFTFFNALFVVPGPFSVFKRKVFEELGDFDEDNLTEDMEMGLRILDAGYQIHSSLNAEVHTVAPEGVLDLMKQRFRWYIGNLRNISAYRHIIPKLNDLSMVLIMSLVSVAVLILAMVLAGRVTLVLVNEYFNLGKGYISLGPSLDFLTERMVSLEYSFNLLDFYLPGMVFTLIFFTSMGLCFILCYRSVDEELKPGIDHLLYATVYNVLLGVMWVGSFLKEFINKIKGEI